MDALVVTNQEPAREMMTEEMILTEAIVTTDVIVPIKYIFFKDKKNLRDYYFWTCLFCHTNNHEVKLTFSLGRNIKQKGVKKNIN